MPYQEIHALGFPNSPRKLGLYEKPWAGISLYGPCTQLVNSNYKHRAFMHQEGVFSISVTPLSLKSDHSKFSQKYSGVRSTFCNKGNREQIDDDVILTSFFSTEYRKSLKTVF